MLPPDRLLGAVGEAARVMAANAPSRAARGKQAVRAATSVGLNAGLYHDPMPENLFGHMTDQVFDHTDDVADHRQRLYGYVPWKPGTSEALLQDVLQVLSQYQAQLPLAIRQVYYRLVNGGHPKGKPFERRLGYVFNRGRRAGLIPWGAVRDDTTSVFA
jgi:hypothetical protein